MIGYVLVALGGVGLVVCIVGLLRLPGDEKRARKKLTERIGEGRSHLPEQEELW